LADSQADKKADCPAHDKGGTNKAGVLPDGRDNSLCAAGSSGDHIVSAFRQHRPQVCKFAPKSIGFISRNGKTVALVPPASIAAHPTAGGAVMGRVFREPAGLKANNDNKSAEAAWRPAAISGFRAN
jgi:hypothetical protein